MEKNSKKKVHQQTTGVRDKKKERDDRASSRGSKSEVKSEETQLISKLRLQKKLEFQPANSRTRKKKKTGQMISPVCFKQWSLRKMIQPMTGAFKHLQFLPSSQGQVETCLNEQQQL